MESQPPRPDFHNAKALGSMQHTPFTSGLVLSESFRVFGANFVPFCMIMAICVAPAIVMTVAGTVLKDDNLLLGGLGLNMLCSLPAQGAMVYGTVQFMAGQELDTSNSIRQGFSSMFRVIMTSMAILVLVFLGLICMVVPGIMFLMIYYVAIPAAVIEGSGVGKSLERSSALTDGVRWSIFGALMSLLFINLACTQLVQMLLHVGLQLGEKTWQVIAVTSAFETVFAALGATMSAVVYVLLRKKHDSVDADELSNVFA